MEKIVLLYIPCQNLAEYTSPAIIIKEPENVA